MVADPGAWQVSESEFPFGGDARAKLRFAARYALLAPSAHNRQGWRFELASDELRVYAERRRATPVVDPTGREQVISCAAALLFLRVALRHFGEQPEIEVSADSNSGLVAVVRLGATPVPAASDHDLFSAIAKRRCYRSPFEKRQVEPAAVERLAAAAVAEGARLHVVRDRASRTAISQLVAVGNRMKWADPEFRHELADALVPNRSSRGDALPGFAFGVGDIASNALPPLVRHIDIGRVMERTDQRLLRRTPLLAVLATDADTLPAWVSAGLALGSVLLHATALGLSASFMSQPVEVPSLRGKLAEQLSGAAPQLLLRFGYGSRTPKATPRLGLTDVLVVADDEVTGNGATPR